MILDTVIIGGGPAGISAAVYLKRAGRDIALLEKKRIGGLLHNANLVENYPGFHEVRGKELAGQMKGQLHKWDIGVVHTAATSLFSHGSGFRVVTPERELHAKTVVLATGTVPKKLDIDGAGELEGIQLFYEVADMPEPVSGKEIIIIGSGDAAFDYALNLASQGASVQILFRGERPKCLLLLRARTEAEPAIKVHPDIDPVAIAGHNDRAVVKCRHLDMEADYVLGAIGRVPDDHLLGDCPESTPGLFTAGDIRQGKCRQVGIAVGDGIRAAMDILDYLDDCKSTNNEE